MRSYAVPISQTRHDRTQQNNCFTLAARKDNGNTEIPI